MTFVEHERSADDLRERRLGRCGELSARFVAIDGDNLHAGTIDAPWGDPSTAISRLLPGDTLYFRGGTYYAAVVRVSGTAANPIVIRSYPGERFGPVAASGAKRFRVRPRKPPLTLTAWP